MCFNFFYHVLNIVHSNSIVLSKKRLLFVICNSHNSRLNKCLSFVINSINDLNLGKFWKKIHDIIPVDDEVLSISLRSRWRRWSLRDRRVWWCFNYCNRGIIWSSIFSSEFQKLSFKLNSKSCLLMKFWPSYCGHLWICWKFLHYV